MNLTLLVEMFTAREEARPGILQAQRGNGNKPLPETNEEAANKKCNFITDLKSPTKETVSGDMTNGFKNGHVPAERPLGRFPSSSVLWFLVGFPPTPVSSTNFPNPNCLLLHSDTLQSLCVWKLITI